MKRLVVGIGSPHGDDHVGWKVIDELERLNNLENVILFKSNGSCNDWLSQLNGVEQVIVVDAIFSQGKPGDILEITMGNISKLSKLNQLSSHAVSLCDCVNLAINAEMLPQKFKIIGIEIKQLDTFSGLSNEVKLALTEVVNTIESTLYQVKTSLCDENT